MAREIKFRAWDKADHLFYDSVTDSRRMCYFGPGYWLDDDGYLQFTSPEGKGPIGDHDQIRFTELMQYTGLKDKNGVEIYEGDILKFADRPPYDMFWHKGTASFWLRLFSSVEGEDGYDSFKAGSWFDAGHSKSCEVIGNIYENPELLHE